MKKSGYGCWNFLVYETNNNNAPFNGKDQSGSALPAAVYFYTLNLETSCGKPVQKTGNVTVIR
ncbi:MAG: gliding motility-associated C-terminal domain-containing protein [Bacteroidia bacterium]|nr:gliding motility-associated C-terminal domain-containing protein [Bacteroidia bacterium]